MSALSVTITSVTEKLFDGEALSVTVPGSEGMLQVLAHHEPFVSTLTKGTVEVKTSTETQSFPIQSGVIEVSNNRATVLL